MDEFIKETKMYTDEVIETVLGKKKATDIVPLSEVRKVVFLLLMSHSFVVEPSDRHKKAVQNMDLSELENFNW